MRDYIIANLKLYYNILIDVSIVGLTLSFPSINNFMMVYSDPRNNFDLYILGTRDLINLIVAILGAVLLVIRIMKEGKKDKTKEK